MTNIGTFLSLSGLIQSKSPERYLQKLEINSSKRMKCPNCSNESLVMSVLQGIEIDYCPSCSGVWLDRGELDKIIERTINETATLKQPVQPQPSPLARVLEEASLDGGVIIKKRDGQSYIVKPLKGSGSPLDVPGVSSDISLDEIINVVRVSREPRQPL